MPRLPRWLALPIGLLLSACDTGAGDRAPDGAPDLSVPFATLQLDAAYPAPFSYLSGVRELPDGRIFVADPLSQVLLRLDLQAGIADTVGRQGAGPQEYEGPDHVLPLPGDSTLLIDLGNARLTVVSPEGEFVEWIPMVRPQENGRARTLFVRFADKEGRLFLTAPYQMEGAPPDSTGISRFNRISETETVVAWAWHPEALPFNAGGRRPMLRPMDDWAAASDGSIAVVRANGFSVDWVRPDGSLVRGPSYDLESYPVGEAEMEAEMEELSRAAIFTSVVVNEGGEQSRRMGRGLPPGGGPGIADFDWPEMLPPFRPNGTLVSPRGEAWIQRVIPPDMAPRYEVFDGEGRWSGFVELPLGAKIVGFGSRPETQGMLYLARVDGVGLLWLERHRLVTP